MYESLYRLDYRLVTHGSHNELQMDHRGESQMGHRMGYRSHQLREILSKSERNFSQNCDILYKFSQILIKICEIHLKIASNSLRNFVKLFKKLNKIVLKVAKFS